MNQSVKFARVRASMDPDRTPTAPGQFFGNNFPDNCFHAWGNRHIFAIRYGAVVAPGTNPIYSNTNYINREIRTLADKVIALGKELEISRTQFAHAPTFAHVANPERVAL